MTINGINYDFIIVGKKDSDCFVIKDLREGMGGMCCVSKYTIGLLMGSHNILGVNKNYSGKNPGVGDITPMLMNGNPATQNLSFPNVSDTKRSAVTAEKGIKLSRAEKASKNAASKKRVQTMKANKKAQKEQAEAEAKQQKVLEQKKKKYQKLLENARKKPLKSKCIIAVSRIEESCGEYHGDRSYSAKVILYTPAAITAFMKIANNLTYSEGYTARELNARLKRGTVKFEAEISDSRFYMLEDNPYVQLVYASSVLLSFEQHYDDYEFDATFTAPDFKWRFSGHHCDEESIRNGFGATADSDSTLSGWRSEILHRGYIYA